MRIIALDASNWTSWQDFYDALLGAIGAPEWHGRSLNALEDSMIWGGINSVEPPYKVRIFGTETLPKEVRDEVLLAKAVLSKGRAEYRATQGRDVEVEMETDR